jgi:radical SAM protein with 4Fe4S-binding SPASM domain
VTEPTVVERSAHSALLAFGDVDARIEAALPQADRARWRAYRADWRRGAVHRPFPLQIDFELNRSCNLKCPMCTWSDPDAAQGRRADWFSLEHFTQIVRDGVRQGLCGVGLNGVNEPLIRRDLPSFVIAAQTAGVLDIMLHTNGTLLDGPMAQALINAGLTRLMVSLDATTQATYDKIRVGADLAAVEANIRRFLAIRDTHTLPVLGVCFVEMAVNAHERAAFVERWRGRADFFSIQSYIDPFGGRRADLAAPTTASSTGVTCTQPFQRMRVSQDGSVHPCCSFYGEAITVGAPGERVDAVWTGQAMRTLRTLHGAGRGAEHPVCRTCLASSYTQAAP